MGIAYVQHFLVLQVESGFLPVTVDTTNGRWVSESAFAAPVLNYSGGDFADQDEAFLYPKLRTW